MDGGARSRRTPGCSGPVSLWHVPGAQPTARRPRRSQRSRDRPTIRAEEPYRSRLAAARPREPPHEGGQPPSTVLGADGDSTAWRFRGRSRPRAELVRSPRDPAAAWRRSDRSGSFRWRRPWITVIASSRSQRPSHAGVFWRAQSRRTRTVSPCIGAPETTWPRSTLPSANVKTSVAATSGSAYTASHSTQRKNGSSMTASNL